MELSLRSNEDILKSGLRPHENSTPQTSIIAYWICSNVTCEVCILDIQKEVRTGRKWYLKAQKTLITHGRKIEHSLYRAQCKVVCLEHVAVTRRCHSCGGIIARFSQLLQCNDASITIVGYGHCARSHFRDAQTRG